MKTIVAYKSKYGFTKKYAEWLAESLSCDIKADASLGDIEGYDGVIFGGGIYAGKINGAKLITKNLNKLENKKLAIFAVGSSAGYPEELEIFWQNALEKDVREKVPHFYLRGGFDYGKLGNIDRLMMNMLKKVLLGKEELSEDDKGLLAAYETPVDFTDRENLADLLKLFSK
ncbi:MAG: flavodoxin domain-containing protein [Ruminococcus sp.]|nr:flavodoxin domain-containing protein [Ruminococcus sp.]MCM1380562.1 flavodoxin domain-containing protein [Muribaculaceae bacterium]MCM1478941.1 flavodoxin domain-containing protein [Muribaculaceae bacterium]